MDQNYIVSLKRIIGQAKRGISFMMAVVLVFTMCQIPNTDVMAEEIVGSNFISANELSDADEMTEDGLSAITESAAETELSVETASETEITYDVSATTSDEVSAKLVKTAENEYALYITGLGAMTDMQQASSCPWYSYRQYIKSLEISGAVSYIGERAFEGCYNLDTVTIASTADSFELGRGAFSANSSLETIDLTGIKLTALGSCVFYNCKALSTINLPSGMEFTIGEQAFYGCTSLQELKIPETTIATIQDQAFAACTSLKKVSAIHMQTAFAGDDIFWNGKDGSQKSYYEITIVCQKDSQAYKFCQVNEYATPEVVDEDGNVIEEENQTYTVTFVDRAGAVLKEMTCHKGTILTDSAAPTVEEREGYDFAGWDPVLTEYTVVDDVQFKPVYEPQNREANDISALGEANLVTYDLSEGGILTISGKGRMKDFESEKECPWYEQRKYIHTVLFTGNITHIGDYVCKGLTNCTKVSFDGITKQFSIGQYAFEEIGVSELKLPAKVTEVANTAFWYMPDIRKIDIYAGTFYGNPFMQNQALDDSVTISFFCSQDVTLKPENGIAFLGGAQENNVNVVLDAISAVTRFTETYDSSGKKTVLDFSHVADLYVPSSGNNETVFEKVPVSGRSEGCNILYQNQDNEIALEIKEVSRNTSQLNIPQYILNVPVTSVVSNTLSNSISVLHTDFAHHTDATGKCRICGRTQYTVSADTTENVYQLTAFDAGTDYYILIDSDLEDDINIFRLAVGGSVFNLSAGKTFCVPEGYTLIVPSGYVFTVADDATLILDGTIRVENKASFINKGTITGAGTFEGNGLFKSSPNEDMIQIVNADDLYQNNENLKVEIAKSTTWYGVTFILEIDTDLVLDEHFEHFTGQYVREEADDANWVRIAVDEIKAAGVYRYVYRDKNGKTVTKRFVVGRPKGTAKVQQDDWYYGEQKPAAKTSSTTNNGSKTYYFYKEKDADDTTYLPTVPTEPGEYTIKVEYLENELYQKAVATDDFEIKKRPIYINLDNVTRPYGKENPQSAEYTFSVLNEVGFVGEDTVADLNLQFSCNATVTSAVAESPFEITVSSDSKYYDVKKADNTGKLYIEKASPNLAISKPSYEKTFGDEPFALSGVTFDGDGSLIYSVDDAHKDVISVTSDGKLKVNNALVDEEDPAIITVKTTATDNSLESDPVEVSVKVKKAAEITTMNEEEYYWKGQKNAISIPLCDYLPQDYGNASFDSGEMQISYSPGCYSDLFGTAVSVDEEGVLTAKNEVRSDDCYAKVTIPVTMRNYEDSTVSLTLHFVGTQKVELASGEAITLKTNELMFGSALKMLVFNQAKFVDEQTKTNEISGQLQFKNPEYTPEVGDGSYTADWVFIPDDSYHGVYENCEGQVVIHMLKAYPRVIQNPETREYVYDTDLKLQDIELTGAKTSVYGNWSWKNGSVVPDYNNDGYTAVFTPNDANYRAIEVENIKVKIKQASLTLEYAPDIPSITYGETLSYVATGIDRRTGSVSFNSTISNTAIRNIEGEYSWEDGSIKPLVSDSDKTEYNLIFTPKSLNYAPLVFGVTITVKKLPYAPDYSSQVQQITVDNTVKKVGQSPVMIPDDETYLVLDDWVWADGDMEKAISQNTTETATAEYNGFDKGCYENETMTFEITREPCQKGDTVYFDSQQTEIKPTCTEGGMGHRKCILCGDVLETDVKVGALGHAYQKPVYEWTVSENTADTTAKAVFTCGRAGCTDEIENHTVSDNCVVTANVVEPSCETDGRVDYTAKVTAPDSALGTCVLFDPGLKTITLPKLGHDVQPVYHVDAATGEETCFNWSTKNDTCSVDFACIRCDEKNHTETVKTTSTCTATCTVDGITTYSATIQYLTFDLKAAKDVDQPALGHKYNNREYTVPATCTTDGYWTYRCNFPGCEESYTVARSKLGHIGGTATCMHKAVCTRCKEEYGHLNPSNHEDVTLVNAKPASCLTDGYTGDKKCPACNTIVEEGKVISAPGEHTWDEGVLIREATPLQKGQKRFTCKECGTSRVQIIYYDPKSDAPLKLQDDQNKNEYQITVDEGNTELPIVTYIKPVKPAKAIVIPATVVIDGTTLNVTRIENAAFQKDRTVVKVTIGKNVKSIPMQCFSGATKLKTVNVGDGVTTIGKEAFYNCKKLTSVKLGKNVKSIGDKAFAKCPKLKTITIPSNVTTLGASLFTGDKSLKTIVIKSKKLTDKKLKKNAFKGVSTKTVIKVPKAKLKAYKKLFVKKGLSKKVKIVGI